jgi:hypothetical protein
VRLKSYAGEASAREAAEGERLLLQEIVLQIDIEAGETVEFRVIVA